MSLHVYHHTFTASLAWVAWQIPFSVNWTGILANTFVHIWMYSYYLLTGVPVMLHSAHVCQTLS